MWRPWQGPIGLRVASVLTIRSKFGIMEKSGKRAPRKRRKVAWFLERSVRRRRSSSFRKFQIPGNPPGNFYGVPVGTHSRFYRARRRNETRETY